MLNYTERLTWLMQDIVARVPALSFIDMADVLVFARMGRTRAEGAFATCHCLTLPASEPAYYFWRDRATGKLTRRSEWFVTRSPQVSVGSRQVKYLLSFALPRFCDQSLERSRKERLYPRGEPWLAKLDTVVHELYHIDPAMSGIRRIERRDGAWSANCHGTQFFEAVAAMVRGYLASGPDPATYDFLRSDFRTLEARYGGVAGTAFRPFPSFPQRYIERLAEQPPCEADEEGLTVEPLRVPQQATEYSEADLYERRFMRDAPRRVLGKGRFRAA